MHIIEKQLIGKTGNPDQCEDFIVITDHFVAVIDGVTGKRKEMEGTGRIAAQILAKIIQFMDSRISMNDCIELLTAGIHRYYQEQGMVEITREDPRNRIAASAIIFSRFHRQIWMMGDCQCLVNDQYYQTPTAIDEITSRARALFNHLELLSGTTLEELTQNDPGREFIKPLLQKQSLLQNNPKAGPHAFFIIDGFPVLVSMVKIVEVPDQAEIVLASDGYPRLFPTLEQSEAYLKEIIQKDPLQISIHPSTKGIGLNNISFDDRAYIRLLTTK